MNEACLNAKWIREDLTQKKAQEFTKAVLNHMRERLSDYQEEYGDLYNLEATPAESTSYRLAKHDVARYENIITANEGNNNPYYTNSSHLPVNYTEDVFEALEIQDELQTLYTSGTVFHTFLGEKLPDWKAAASIVRKIAENYRLPYYTLSPTYSVCKNHGYIAGEHFKCDKCGENTEVYSRITGYYRPVQNWNTGKSQEYKDRREYVLETSVCKRSGCETPVSDTVLAFDEAPKVSVATKTISLFATKTCPNCKIATSLLEKAGVAFEKVYVEDNRELAKSYELKMAPTLVVSDGENIEKFAGVQEIKSFIKSVGL